MEKETELCDSSQCKWKSEKGDVGITDVEQTKLDWRQIERRKEKKGKEKGKVLQEAGKPLCRFAAPLRV